MCISILHAPGDDPMGYEVNIIMCLVKPTLLKLALLNIIKLSAERWSPVQSVEKILLSVVSMLAGK